ncbi:acyltransferase, partial [Alphaproteobacteria bacterium]|nr:acyltransferase [Alphaproteobacteria bacterium]
MKYRAEIDGLRALAVVPVILFHAGFEIFSGGFVGVDVFFVISGYLITTILIEDIENKRFSIVNFYERRARRILPALFFVMLVCIPFAWMWMLPSQMKDFSQSLVAVSLFASNILFWRESGYFDAAAEEKPLLHTWSLAVEEQYYVLFPIFLILAWRFGKNRVFWMVVVMAAISLLLSEWGWRNKATANFYLAPTRAWELFAGSIAAFIVQKQGVQKSNALALVGLAAIIFSIFFYDETTPFPSVYALVPVLGVVLLVLYADKETFAAKILSTKGFVGVGLISYSAYLWHQPLFAFARIRLLDNPPTMLMAGLSVMSVFLAYLSWKFVETPFRKKSNFGKKSVFILSMSGIFCALILGIIGHLQNGFEKRFDYSLIDLVGMESKKPNIKKLFGCQEKDATNLDSIFCVVNGRVENPKIAIFGDSHADVIAMSLQHSGESFVVSSLGGCAPLINVDVVRGNLDRDVCRNLTLKQLDFVKSNRNIKEVLLVGRWSLYTSGDYQSDMKGYFLTTPSKQDINQKTSREVFSKELQKTIETYQENGLKVSVLLQVPQQLYNPIKAITKTYLTGNKENKMLLQTPLTEHQKLQSFNRSVIDSIRASEANLRIINLDERFCDDSICRMLNDKSVLYRDNDHLSLTGAHYISS